MGAQHPAPLYACNAFSQTLPLGHSINVVAVLHVCWTRGGESDPMQAFMKGCCKRKASQVVAVTFSRAPGCMRDPRKCVAFLAGEIILISFHLRQQWNNNVDFHLIMFLVKKLFFFQKTDNRRTTTAMKNIFENTKKYVAF